MRALQFTRMCQDGLDVFTDRNKEYGDAIVETGVLGACVELVGATARLKVMVVKNPKWGVEPNFDRAGVLNCLLDIHNYANIGLMMLEENNLRGQS
jgi:hypothetical protein